MKKRKAFKSYNQASNAFNEYRRKHEYLWAKRRPLPLLVDTKPYGYYDRVYRQALDGYFRARFTPRIKPLMGPYKPEEWPDGGGNPKNKVVAKARQRQGIMARLHYINPDEPWAKPLFQNDADRSACLKPNVIKRLSWVREAMADHWKKMSTVDFQSVQERVNEIRHNLSQLRSELDALYSKCDRLDRDGAWDRFNHQAKVNCAHIEHEIGGCESAINASERVYKRRNPHEQ